MEHNKELWIDEARTIAAQCRCAETTSHIEMDVELAEVFAQRIAAWMATGSQHATNESYWRDRALSAEQQLVALLAALEKAEEYLRECANAPILAAGLRAAIAKVKP